VNVKIRRHLLLGLLFVSAALFAAEPARPDMRGEVQDVDLDTGDTVLRGNAVLVVKDLTMRAEEIRYSSKQAIAVAKGKVVLTLGARRVIADELTYHFADDSFRIEKPRLGEFPFYVSGSYADGTSKRISFHDARASFMEPNPWTPTLGARTLVYETEGSGSISADMARVGVGSVQPLVLPKFNHKMDVPVLSMMSFTGGYRGNLGVFVEPELRLPVNSGLRLGADFGAYSRRGFMVGPAGDYSVKMGPDSDMQGKFRSGYINDHGNRYIDVLGDAVPEDRGYVSWEHHQTLAPSLRVDGTFSYWSDSEVVRDFRHREFYSVQVPDSYLEAAYAGDNYLLSLFSRVQPNTYFAVQERLPELRFDLLPIELAGGVYQRMQASYAVLRDDEPTGLSTLKSDRADAYYGLTRNFSPREWMGATLVAGGRVTNYAHTVEGSDRGSYTRTLGEIGFDAHVSTSGTFDYSNERWKINGLRHLLTPRLTYRYIPEAEKGSRYIPQIDRLNFNTYLPQLGLGDIRHIDDMHETNVLRASVENVLQTRDATYGSRDLASLTLANDFRFTREEGKRKVSQTAMDMALMPARWMRLEVYQSFKPQTLALHELNTGLTLHDGDQWALRLGTHYLRHDIEEYAIEYSYRLTEAYTAYTRVHYDSRRSRFNERTIGIQHLLGRTWLVRYAVSFYNDTRREGDFEFHVDIRSINF
jgi:LPS-assembly protein